VQVPPAQTPLQQSAAARQPASPPAQTQLLPSQRELQQSDGRAQAVPSAAQQAVPPSEGSQARPTQHPASSVHALPAAGQQPPQRQLSPAAHPAPQPAPALGQQRESTQLPWQQSAPASQIPPAGWQVAAPGGAERPLPRTPPQTQEPAESSSRAKWSRRTRA
jgi:hypothetical protein